VSHPSFCSFHWKDTLVDLAKCEVRSCCKTPAASVSLEQLKKEGIDVFSNSHQVRERRRQALKGEKPSSCEYCWNLEEKNQTSLRSRSESFEDFHASLDSQSATEPTKTLSIDTLEIIMKNTCQMKCVYCSPQFSSSWQSEEDEHQGSSSQSSLTLLHQEQFLKTFLQYLPEALKTVSHVHFIGGEPLIQRDLYKLIQKIRDVTRAQKRQRLLEIDIITNLSLPPKLIDRVFRTAETLPRSIRLNLCPSIESVGSQAEYARTGLNWSRFDTNLRQILNSDLFPVVPVISTFNIFCVTGFAEFLEYLLSLPSCEKISLRMNPVNGRPELEPDILGTELLGDIERSLTKLKTHSQRLMNTEEVEAFLLAFSKSLAANAQRDEVRLAGLIRFIEQVDKRRGLSFEYAFPRLAKMII